MIERRLPIKGLKADHRVRDLAGIIRFLIVGSAAQFGMKPPMDNRRCAGLFPLSLWRWRLDIAALEQVIEPADPIPAIAVSLEQQVMFSVFSSSAVIVGQ
jgi:hypothetical protein